MSAVYTSNIVINTGSTFNQTFDLESTDTSSAFDLSGYTAAAQMRKWAGSTTATSFVASIPVPVTQGKVILSMSATTTSGLAAGRYVYDITLTAGSTVERVIEGMVLVREGVTR
tara:strand:- start:4554 stop:4895 length:342 start_codon:yes stop_codon:yes gene_type:complete